MSDRLSRRDTIRPAIAGDSSDPLGIPEAVSGFLEYLTVHHYSIRTVNLRAFHLREFARWLQDQGVTHVGEVTPAMLYDFQRWLYQYRMPNGQARSVQGQFQRLNAVRMLFRYLSRSRFIPFNPAADLEMPRREHRLPKAPLTTEEMEQVLAQPDLDTRSGVRDRAILETLFATGIRRAELSSLRVVDVDFEGETLRVNCGKGKRDRVVPVSARALGGSIDTRPQSVPWLQTHGTAAHCSSPDSGNLAGSNG